MIGVSSRYSINFSRPPLWEPIKVQIESTVVCCFSRWSTVHGLAVNNIMFHTPLQPRVSYSTATKKVDLQSRG
jgi:hypothetical protein